MRRFVLTTTVISLFSLLINDHAKAQERSRVITLTAIAGLQFDNVRFSVTPGESVRIVLKNADDMSHNLVVTKPGKRESVVNAAVKLEEKGPEMDYIPRSDDVLWSIPVLAPGEEASVEFVAPKEPGVYPYVCTFPGHGFYMFGAMYVGIETLPPLAEDPHVPSFRSTKKQDHHAGSPALHPYSPEPPYLYRAYMEESGPASIAVRVTDTLSYCWDAQTCDLRYAWEGEFVDNTALWKGKPNAVARVLGEIFYRNKATGPLRIGDPSKTPTVKFRGYRLVDRMPEFHYTVDGVEVFEMITATEDGLGLIRKFRIPGATRGVWFFASPYTGISYNQSNGQAIRDRIEIPIAQTSEFSITINRNK